MLSLFKSSNQSRCEVWDISVTPATLLSPVSSHALCSLSCRQLTRKLNFQRMNVMKKQVNQHKKYCNNFPKAFSKNYRRFSLEKKRRCKKLSRDQSEWCNFLCFGVTFVLDALADGCCKEESVAVCSTCYL